MNIEQSSNKFTLHDDKKPDLNDTRGKAVLPQAMQLLGEEDGRKISLKAQNTPQDAYFAFILLRHLRIRDIRIKVIDYYYAYTLPVQSIYYQFYEYNYHHLCCV